MLPEIPDTEWPTDLRHLRASFTASPGEWLAGQLGALGRAQSADDGRFYVSSHDEACKP